MAEEGEADLKRLEIVATRSPLAEAQASELTNHLVKLGLGNVCFVKLRPKERWP